MFTMMSGFQEQSSGEILTVSAADGSVSTQATEGHEGQQGHVCLGEEKKIRKWQCYLILAECLLSVWCFPCVVPPQSYELCVTVIL